MSTGVNTRDDASAVPNFNAKTKYTRKNTSYTTTRPPETKLGGTGTTYKQAANATDTAVVYTHKFISTKLYILRHIDGVIIAQKSFKLARDCR